MHQTISQELASNSKAKGEDSKWVELDEEGILQLGECLEDETSSLNGLFHLKMGYYEVFQPNCNMLQIQEEMES